jgi:hypothetical protein
MENFLKSLSGWKKWVRHAAAINEKFFCENIFFLVSKDDSLKSDDDLQVFFAKMP